MYCTSGRKKRFCYILYTKVEEGMNVRTHSKEVIEARKVILDLILSNHQRDCLTCTRNGNCELQNLAVKFNVTGVEYEGEKTNTNR